MVVVAIVSILAVIAIPVYIDYVIRSKTSEGMVFAAEAKTSVSEYYYSNSRQMPLNNLVAGLPSPDLYDKDEGFIKRLELSSSSSGQLGVINVTFKIPGSTADGKILQLIPATVNGLISWTCESPTDGTGVPINQAPPSCRG
jgi:type IV pilus assembly protein PilA